MKPVPIVIDTDIFFDPDDMFAIEYAQNCKEFSIIAIITNHEYGTKRARKLTKVLEDIDKDIPIAAGEQAIGDYLGNEFFFLFNDSIPEVNVRTDYITMLKEVVDDPQKTTYLGLGCLSNMANIIKDKDLRDMRFIQMGGKIKTDKERRTPHNIRVDIEASKNVINSKIDLTLILSDTTRNKNLSVTRESKFYQKLKESENNYHKLLLENCNRFYKRLYPKYLPNEEFHMHDPLTLSAAYFSFVKFVQEKIIMNEKGNLEKNDKGNPIKISTTVDYRDFMEHLHSYIFR